MEHQNEVLEKVQKAIKTLKYLEDNSIRQLFDSADIDDLFNGLESAENLILDHPGIIVFPKAELPTSIPDMKVAYIGGPILNFGGVSENVINEIISNGSSLAESQKLFDEVLRPQHGIAVDCGCLDGNNPGLFEYRTVDIASGKIIERIKIPGTSTNNIAEFLALVHGILYCYEQNINTTVYSDSKNALAWLRKGVCRTKFDVRNPDQRNQIKLAEEFLKTTNWGKQVKVAFWSNKRFGETPADLSGKKGVKK